MDEKQFTEAVEPIVDELIKVSKRIDEVSKQEGPEGKPGADADPEVVAEKIKSDDDFVERLKGNSGKTHLSG